MRWPKRAVVAVLVGVCIVSGCAKSKPSTWTKSEAAEQFKARYAVVAADRTQLQTVSAQGSLSTIQLTASRVAIHEKDLVGHLSEGKWPTDATDEIADLSTAVGKEADLLSRLGAAGAIADANAVMKDIPAADKDVTTALAAVSATLGISPS